ncbi:MAG: hypothetical protein K8I82_24335 [Anaerolineae bacterium]|nr:hypothetical protein [Anaerolineae bacterium]
MTDMWLSQALTLAQPLQSSPIEEALVKKLLDMVTNFSAEYRKNMLAAAFDLLIAAEYYGNVTHTGWLYCPSPEPLLLYPYTNTCPRCVLERRFEYHKANKPKSGSIGATTSRFLCLFTRELFIRKGLTIEIFRGTEPIDAIFLDKSTLPATIFFAEIKASPLVTLPLAVPSQKMVVENSNSLFDKHKDTDLSVLFGSPIFLLLPSFEDGTLHWTGLLYPLGERNDIKDQTWAYRGLDNLLNEPSFFEKYFLFWQSALENYKQRNPQSVYWLTNGCGQPMPRPEHWPRRAGTGFESVSDSKTSVGMDRTDDIKKAIYQVLKLGVEGKPSRQFQYKTGIISNIHAARHFDEYLASLKDVIWTRENTGQVKTVGELNPETELFNLFDGMVALTEIHARDNWVMSVFDF